MGRETVKETVKYAFSESEKRDLAGVVTQAVVKRDELKAQLKTVQGQIKSQVDELDARVVQCSDKYRSGYEMRDMEVEKEMDFLNDVVRFYRLDTGELALERGMTIEERQMRIKLN
jgi:hypothetical protein